MGTSALVVFKKDNIETLTYTHYDGNPKSVGFTTLSYIKQQGIKMIEEKFLKCKVVNQSTTPTKDDILNLKVYSNFKVGSRNENDWYCLTHSTQGDIRKILDSEYIFDFESAITNWKYVINFDTQCFEVHNIDKLLYEIKFHVLRLLDYDLVEILMEELEALNC